MSLAAARRRGRQRARVHERHLRPGLPCPRRHPGAPGRRGPTPRYIVSDDLDGWGGADFVLAADRLDTPHVVEAAGPPDMPPQGGPARGPGRPPARAWAGARPS